MIIVPPGFLLLTSFTPQDLVFIEEAFERLLLDYARVFSAMGVPACLWRRTWESYKGNQEFSELVGVEGYMLRDVRLFFGNKNVIMEIKLFFRAVFVSMSLWLKNLL